MIADEIGVTKAAIYHQYRAKDDIVVAAAEAELARLDAVIRDAESQSSRKRARNALIIGIVDLAVARRRIVGTILSDPHIVAVFAEHEGFRDVCTVCVACSSGENADLRHESKLPCSSRRSVGLSCTPSLSIWTRTPCGPNFCVSLTASSGLPPEHG